MKGRLFSPLSWFLMLGALILIAGLLVPMLDTGPKPPILLELNHLKGLAESSRFESGEAGEPTPEAKYSHHYFNQLIRHHEQISSFEHPHFEKAFAYEKPSGDQLKGPDNPYAYISGLTRDSSGDSPLVFTTPYQLDPEPSFSKLVDSKGRMLIARVDGSIRAMQLEGNNPVHTPALIDGQNPFTAENLPEGSKLIPSLLTDLPKPTPRLPVSLSLKITLVGLAIIVLILILTGLKRHRLKTNKKSEQSRFDNTLS